jgi:hypothetical protein
MKVVLTDQPRRANEISAAQQDLCVVANGHASTARGADQLS